MRLFFSGAFKDNRNLSYGFLTGILRIAQESIFSGLNYLSVNSIMDEDYNQFFGFTSSEVYEMLQMLSGRLMKNVMMQNGSSSVWHLYSNWELHFRENA